MLNKEQLKDILEKHKLWLMYKTGGKRADLSGTDLSGADLSYANLSGADLSYANLSKTNMSKANMSEANLSGANLRGADLKYANLSGATLFEANLSGANLREADLSGATGLLSPIDYLAANFERTNEGYIVYKVFGLYHNPSKEWNITKGSIIKENVNPNRTDVCGCGINVATKEWIKVDNPKITKAWKMLIKWEWLAGVVVPYNTDGKIRCERAMLLEDVDI